MASLRHLHIGPLHCVCPEEKENVNHVTKVFWSKHEPVTHVSFKETGKGVVCGENQQSNAEIVFKMYTYSNYGKVQLLKGIAFFFPQLGFILF